MTSDEIQVPILIQHSFSYLSLYVCHCRSVHLTNTNIVCFFFNLFLSINVISPCKGLLLHPFKWSFQFFNICISLDCCPRYMYSLLPVLTSLCLLSFIIMTVITYLGGPSFSCSYVF